MCQRLMTRIVHRCQHVIDSPGDVVEYNNCGKCGNIVKTSYLGQTTRRDPCLDCISRGVWVQVNGTWQKAWTWSWWTVGQGAYHVSSLNKFHTLEWARYWITYLSAYCTPTEITVMGSIGSHAENWMVLCDTIYDFCSNYRVVTVH